MHRFLTAVFTAILTTFYAGAGLSENLADQFACIEYSTEKTEYVTMPDADAECLLKFSFWLLRDLDKSGSLKWLTIAANRGSPKAQAIMGVRYLRGSNVRGEGLKKDLEQAIFWLRKSAQGGNLLAQDRISQMYMNGNKFIGRDLKKGANLALSVAKKGYQLAMPQVAEYYAFGIGLDNDPVEAMKWAIISKKFSYIDENLFRRIERNVDPNIRAELTNDENWMTDYVER
tara:strand:+ start:162 stop:851 length:690 start_codon:yes stop_codon:yes gene_type:complete